MTTSNCPVEPGMGVAGMPSFFVISAARPAARVSYPLQVGQ
ncbi:MAG TPA: hypothetical protein VIG93_09300 [Gaiellaceae bacterium]